MTFWWFLDDKIRNSFHTFQWITWFLCTTDYGALEIKSDRVQTSDACWRSARIPWTFFIYFLFFSILSFFRFLYYIFSSFFLNVVEAPLSFFSSKKSHMEFQLGRTDERTDGRTDTPSYRDAGTHLTISVNPPSEWRRLNRVFWRVPVASQTWDIRPRVVGIWSWPALADSLRSSPNPSGGSECFGASLCSSSSRLWIWEGKVHIH